MHRPSKGESSENKKDDGDTTESDDGGTDEVNIVYKETINGQSSKEIPLAGVDGLESRCRTRRTLRVRTQILISPSPTSLHIKSNVSEDTSSTTPESASETMDVNIFRHRLFMILALRGSETRAIL